MTPRMFSTTCAPSPGCVGWSLRQLSCECSRMSMISSPSLPRPRPGSVGGASWEHGQLPRRGPSSSRVARRRSPSLWSLSGRRRATAFGVSLVISVPRAAIHDRPPQRADFMRYSRCTLPSPKKNDPPASAPRTPNGRPVCGFAREIAVFDGLCRGGAALMRCGGVGSPGSRLRCGDPLVSMTCLRRLCTSRSGCDRLGILPVFGPGV